MMNPDGGQAAYFEVDTDQWAATDPHRNIAVTAGAGSGKTRVLTTRYIRLLRENPSLASEQIAAITFTEKAALEMKDRIRRMIEREISGTEQHDARVRWCGIHDRIGTAPIGTIHSFCSRLLREHFYRMGLAPDFQVLNETEQNTKMRQLAEESVDAFGNQILNQDEAEPLVRLFGADGLIDGTLSGCLITMYGKIREQGMGMDEALRVTEKRYQGPDDAKALRVENILLAMVQTMDRAYRKWKEQHNRLDFADLEVLAHRLLEDQAVQSQVRMRYRFIMMDEFQDTNPLQKEIVYQLVGDEEGLEENRLFIVGDHKQSIYGFRGTDYRIFSQVCQDMDPEAIRSLSVCFRSSEVLIEAVNAIFKDRMDPYDPLLPAEAKTGLGGHPVELIVCPYEKGGDPRSNRVAEVEKSLQDDHTDGLDDSLRDLEEMSSSSRKEDLETGVLCRRIAQIHGEGVPYEDMAILIRTRFPLPRIEAALRREGIPYCVLGGTGLMEKQEIVDLVNLFKAVYDPQDAIALAAVLRSPYLGLADPVLQQAGAILFTSSNDPQRELEMKSVGMDPHDRHVLQKALDRLRRLRSDAHFTGAGEMLRRLIRELDFEGVLTGQENGSQKVRNMEKLQEIAHEFDRTGLFRACDFPDFLRTLSESQSGGSEAALDTEDSAAVKIMTIHGSKGLEFDTVLVPDMGRSLASSNRRKPLAVFHPELGVVVRKCADESSSSDLEDPWYDRVCDDLKHKEEEEAIRVMYVAATRAKERLVFLGTEKSGQGKSDTFMEILEAAAARHDDAWRWFKRKEGYEVMAAQTSVPGAHEQSSSQNVEDPESIKAMIRRLQWRWEGQVPVRSSVSQYLMYKECPRRYFLSVRLGLDRICAYLTETKPSKPDLLPTLLPPALRGTVVHHIIEAMHGRPEGSWTEQTRKSLEQFSPGMSPQDAATAAASLSHYLDHYRTLTSELIQEYGGRPAAVETEFPFRMPLSKGSPVSLQGVIDRILIFALEDGYVGHVVDFKTNRIREDADHSKLKEMYLPQLMVYRRATEQFYRAHGRKLDACRSSLFLLDAGLRVDMDPDPQKDHQIIASMEEAFAYMARHNSLCDYPPCRESVCQYCQFSVVCSALHDASHEKYGRWIE
jgi:ATP-dependent helicase/nuclease subunit A